jgi:transcriptional regulator GlxA family with amidase domain
MLERHPTIDYVADRRLVVDGRVATTTGISASMPIALTLIEAIAGRAKAEEVARDLGLAAGDARHDSGAFKFNSPFATTVLGNTLAFWRRDHFGIPLEPGVDEVSLALVADAWSRTYRSRAETFANNPDGVATRSGLRVIPDRVASAWPDANVIPSFEHRPPVQALDAALEAIADRYGAPTASVVAMQLEYPWKSPPASS